MSNGLRALLVVPTYQSRTNNEPRYERARLEKLVGLHSPDLVVFPEGFERVASPGPLLREVRGAAVRCARAFARELEVPVLMGVWVDKVRGTLGMQCASYANPKPRHGETEAHFYAKHSTSQVLPYDLADYDAERDAMFEPIELASHRLGVQLCHDQFFGLVSGRLMRRGADVLFDLTGDSVVASKWRNVLAGRSLEHHVPFICTMTRNLSARTNRAFATGFRDGRELMPEKSYHNEHSGDFVLVDTDASLLPADVEQAISQVTATELTISVQPASPSQPVDVFVERAGVRGVNFGAWTAVGETGILVLDAKVLHDPLCIHRVEKPTPRPTTKNIVCFVSTADSLSSQDALILARLRALEHRVAIVICTPSVREVIKTSRYKNIQRIAERNGVFGLDGAFMKGTYASMAGVWPSGIPDEHHAAYARLLD